jgi:SAM-dependent methyltransferase
MTHALQEETLSAIDAELAHRFGEYAGFETAVSPHTVQIYGSDPRRELQRLLTHFLKPTSRILDLGCGAGHTLCKVAPYVTEAWGFDQEPTLLEGAKCRATYLKLHNVILATGNVAATDNVAPLPDDYFDIIYSQRGPNINQDLIPKLKKGGFYLQSLVGSYDGFHLREILGRRPFTHYAFRNESERMIGALGNLGLQTIQISEQFYESFFRDVDQLAAYLSQDNSSLSDWRVGHHAQYDPEKDRAALDLYAQYNSTRQGVRTLHHRIFFVGRKTAVHYYPFEGVYD